MAASDESRPAPLGLVSRAESAGPSPLEVALAAGSGLWLVLAGGWLLLFPGNEADETRFLLVLMVVFLPAALFAVAATSLRATRIMRAESARLEAAVDALRQTYVSEAQKGRGDAQGGAVMRRLDEIAATQRRLEAALAGLEGAAAPAPPPAAPAPAPRRAAAEPGETAPAEDGAAAAAAEQPALALGTPAGTGGTPLSNADLIRALSFPETAEDREGFAALRRALRDRPSAQLVQAAQDVLTLLSEDGIYMDDLRPDRARPELWRRFAQGVRGREIAALGGLRDAESLDRIAARMKRDPIFRDAAHHFLRLFDRGVARFEPAASDAEIGALADTRSARAFMLLGRVAGTFD
ncbi:hypothetical protein [Roseivivax sp. CAU 1761]